MERLLLLSAGAAASALRIIPLERRGAFARRGCAGYSSRQSASPALTLSREQDFHHPQNLPFELYIL